jgi:hypothetical protein
MRKLILAIGGNAKIAMHKTYIEFIDRLYEDIFHIALP